VSIEGMTTIETSTEFGESLLSAIRAGRSFGGHPLWFKIQEGRLPLAAVRRFACQFFLQVVEFPRAVSALHSRCGDRQERVTLAESLYEEETGKLSGTKPHPELFLDFCAGLGLERAAVISTAPLPSTAALVQWFEYATKLLPFLEGVAAINLAAEGQVVGAFAPFARGLQQHYGLSRDAVAFWDVHELADADHADVGDHIVVTHATSSEAQTGVRRAVETSLAMWWQFFDGIDRRYAGA
jgi:pyrroloquinoline-quinone synthase